MSAAEHLIYPPQAAAGEWIAVGKLDELFAGSDCHGVTLNGLKIGLFRVNGELFALDDICTHGNARLSDGDLDDYEIECPLHAGAFDLRSGKALCSPLSKDTRCHAIKVENGLVYVQLSE